MDEVLPLFLAEARALLAQLDADLGVLAGRPRDAAARARARRALHTLKGSCGFLDLDDVATLAHRGEDLLDGGGAAAEIAALAVAIRARLAALGEGRTAAADAPDAWAGLTALADNLGRSLGKEFDFVVADHGVVPDAETARALRRILPHLLRNAADHGLEPAAERIAAGKPARGTIVLSAAAAAGRLTVAVRDDGRGVDLAALGRAAVAQGAVAAAALAAMDAEATAALVFAPGLTTAVRPSALSGRGIGLDAVKHETEALGGRVSVATGAWGTAVTLALPRRAAVPARAA